jgi:pimeloyl-ACP methyl ester carboxylesterase
MVDALCTATDRTEELASVSPPTLVCFGSNDDAWAPQEQRLMGEALKAAVVELPGLGHSPAVENPTLTTQTLVDFWNERR